MYNLGTAPNVQNYELGRIPRRLHHPPMMLSPRPCRPRLRANFDNASSWSAPGDQVSCTSPGLSADPAPLMVVWSFAGVVDQRAARHPAGLDDGSVDDDASMSLPGAGCGGPHCRLRGYVAATEGVQAESECQADPPGQLRVGRCPGCAVGHTQARVQDSTCASCCESEHAGLCGTPAGAAICWWRQMAKLRWQAWRDRPLG
jgi:hypothetical protein